MVVEAVPERLDLKKTIFGDLDRLGPQGAILASNSSSYPSSQFIERVTKPSRVVNTHYYMPPAEESRQIESHVPECRECQRKLLCMIALSEHGLPSWRSENSKSRLDISSRH